MSQGAWASWGRTTPKPRSRAGAGRGADTHLGQQPRDGQPADLVPDEYPAKVSALESIVAGFADDQLGRLRRQIKRPAWLAGLGDCPRPAVVLQVNDQAAPAWRVPASS